MRRSTRCSKTTQSRQSSGDCMAPTDSGPPMYWILADLVVWLHLAFIAFVVLGGWLALQWPRIIWFHLPAAIWGAVIELMGWHCPLTPLEKHFRAAAGDTPYGGDFVGQYVLPLIYPDGLTRSIQVGIGCAVITINLCAYGLLLRRVRN